MTPLEQAVLERAIREKKRRAQSAQPQGGVSTNSQAVGEFGDKMRALGRGFASGVTYGLADEGSAAVGATLGLTPGGDAFDYSGNWRDRYEQNRDNIRAGQDQSREENPMQFNTGEVGGGTVQAIATTPLATATTLPRTMGMGGLLGGIEGGLFGAGSSDGENLLENTKRGAIVGGGIGVLAPAVVAGGAAVKDMAFGGIDSLLDRGSKSRASRSIAQTIRRSGQTSDDVASAVQRAQSSGQPMYRAVDAMGDSGQRRLSGIVRGGGDNSSEITEYLRQRAVDAPDRLSAFTDDAFGLGGKTRKILEGEVKGNRKRVADALYARAAKDALPVDVRPTIQALDETIGQMSNSGIKPPAVVKKMMTLRSKLAGQTPDGDPTTLSDYNSVRQIWQELRDDIDNMFQPGSKKTAIAAELTQIRDMLEESLSESSDLFSSANQLYRRGSEVLEAFETGAQAAKRGGRASDNIDTFEALSGQEQRAARIGYGDETIKRIEGANSEAPNVSRQMASSKRKAEAAAMAIDPEQYASRLAREGDMFKTFNTALGGSRTADNLNDIADVGALADLSRAGVDASTGNTAGTISNLFSAVRPLLSGQNPETQKLVARALLSRDPGTMLRQAERAGAISETIRRTIEGLMRSSGRTFTQSK